MRSITLLSLLIVQCWMYQVALTEDSQYISTDSMPVVATINFKGSSLKVFEFEGFQVAEPRISFGEYCDSIRYSYLYQKYQFTLPLNIDINVLSSPTESSKRIGHVILSDLQVKLDEGLGSRDAKVTLIATLRKSGQAQLVFLCDTFLRCQQLKDEIGSFPDSIQDAVRLVAFGRISGNYVKFGALSSANAPKFDCIPGQWIVFQKRVDGNLSFAQSWDSYVKGFGNPDSNYWMGLDKLSTMTITSGRNDFPETARCQLRIETQDLKGNKYWGEYNRFEVLGAEQNYRLRVGHEVAGSQLTNFVTTHNEMFFSTFDRDNDSLGPGSCSQMFGYGGWWYKDCHSVNLNGAYTTDKGIDHAPVYSSVYREKFLPMRRTVMKFKCF